MVTKLISTKDFRANLSVYARKAQKGNTRFIVMHRNSPLFELKPFAKDDGLESIVADILAAKEDVKRGRVHTQKNIVAEFS
jgi:hypothetical protein